MTLILLKSVFHAFTCASDIQSYIYVAFYEIVNECSKKCLGHAVTQCINIPRVVCSSCMNKNMPSGVSPEKLGCHQVSWHARVMIHPHPKVGPKVKKNTIITKTSFGCLDIISWEYVKRNRVAEVCSKPRGPILSSREERKSPLSIF